MTTTTRPKPFAFVLMPFDEGFDDIYNLGIKAACADAGAYCERVDEQLFQESILERVYNQISKADIIIADMTGRNPNVFYETGYAHALGKRVILLTQKTDDIPFDLKHYPHIIYGGKIGGLKNELEKRVRWIIEQPNDLKAAVEPMIQLYIGGVHIVENAILKFVPGYMSKYQRSGAGPSDEICEVDFHNPSGQIVNLDDYRFALHTRYWSPSIAADQLGVHNNAESYIIPLSITGSLFPGEWKSSYCILHFLGRARPDQEEEAVSALLPVTFRIMSASGVKDIPIQVRAVFRKAPKNNR